MKAVVVAFNQLHRLIVNSTSVDIVYLSGTHLAGLQAPHGARGVDGGGPQQVRVNLIPVEWSQRGAEIFFFGFSLFKYFSMWDVNASDEA